MEIIKEKLEMPNDDMFSIIASNSGGFKITIASSEGYITFENKEELEELVKALIESYFDIYNSYLININSYNKKNFLEINNTNQLSTFKEIRKGDELNELES